VGWIHHARAVQLARTVAALKAQYGPNDPGVKSAEAAVAAAKATASRFGVVHQQFTTADPEVAQNGWALHGRVFNDQLAPASAYTVFLVDAAKAYQQAYGFTYTDDTGYFVLNYQPGDTVSGRKSAAATQTASATELFIEVADRKARPVYLSATAFQPVVGRAAYQNIVLPAGQHPIGDPPEQTRKVAVPKRTRKT
jgi:hypothetical protein